MKKLLFILIVSIALTSCSNGEVKQTKTDSTKVDSSKIKKDSL